MGPLISPEAKARVEFLIQTGVDEGAKLLLDGRRVSVKGYENGNFVGPTILADVTVRFCSAVIYHQKVQISHLHTCSLLPTNRTTSPD